jgi:hypothetical protein
MVKTGTSAPSDGEAKASAAAMVELWRVDGAYAARLIDDAEDAGRWPEPETLRLLLRRARLGVEGMLASDELWGRWAALAKPQHSAPDGEARASRRAARELYDAINARAEDVMTGAAPRSNFIGWACEQVPSLAARLAARRSPPPPVVHPRPAWVPPPTAAAKAVAERIVRAERKV